jgi:protein-disulfide isomerase
VSRRRLLAALAAVAAVTLTAAAVPAAAATTAQRDWTKVVAASAEGGFTMGNPKAPVKLVEYGSYTCPHCAAFASEANQALKADIRTGRLSWEFRPFLLFPTDPGITLLMRCQGAAAAFPLAEKIYADQPQWVGRVRDLPEAEKQRIKALPFAQQIGELVRRAGVDQYFRQRGMTAARVNACLGDGKALARSLQFSKTAAEKYDVHGTPTFFINGKKVADAASWAGLQPALNKALGR